MLSCLSDRLAIYGMPSNRYCVEQGVIRPVRLGLVGAGAIAGTHADAALRTRAVDLVAVCDMNVERAATLGARAGAACYGSMTAMIDNEELDGVIVATPPNSHATIARFAAQRHLHVLCEMPFAPDVDSAVSMIETARAKRTTITMASKFRFVSAVRAAQKMIADARTGELLMIENTFTRSIMMNDRWNSDPAISGGGVIIDDGTHAVDIFRFLAGPLTNVSASEYRRYQHLDVEDTAMLFARCANGAVATSDLSWTVDKRSPYYLRLHCENAMLEIGWKHSRIRYASDPEWVAFDSGYSKIDAFTGLLDNFAGAILGHELPAVSPEDALASVIAISEAYRSLDARKLAWA